MHLVKAARLTCFAFALAGAFAVTTADLAAAQLAPCCIVPDNGTGTADLPAHCAYHGSSAIINGLPPGTTIQIDAYLVVNTTVSQVPGGILGGYVEDFTADLVMTLTGTGTLLGYNRNLVLPLNTVGGERTNSAPRTLFAPIQSFDMEMIRLQGQITGDPDFDLLRITGGDDFGMPSPGHTTLTTVSGSWSVASFFDIFHRVDFVGKPGGPLGGMSGSTTLQRRFETCPQPTPAEVSTWGGLKARFTD